MADEKVNMGPEENKPPETLSPPGQGNLPPLEENNAPAVSGEDKAAPDHVEPDPLSADKHTQQTVLPGMGEDTPAPAGKGFRGLIFLRAHVHFFIGHLLTSFLME